MAHAKAGLLRSSWPRTHHTLCRSYVYLPALPSSGFHALIGSLIHSKTFLKHHVRMSRLLDEGVGIRTPPSSSPALSAEHLSPYIQKELILALLGNSARTLIWRSLRGPSLIQASYKTVECTHSWLIRYNEEVITREDLQQGARSRLATYRQYERR